MGTLKNKPIENPKTTCQNPTNDSCCPSNINHTHYTISSRNQIPHGFLLLMKMKFTSPLNIL